MDIYCNSRGSAWNLQKSAVISSELDLTYTNHLRFMEYYFKSLEIAATFLCYYIELQTPPQHFEFIDARPVRSQSTWNSSDWQHLSPNLVDNLERWYSDYRFVSRRTCLFLFSSAIKHIFNSKPPVLLNFSLLIFYYSPYSTVYRQWAFTTSKCTTICYYWKIEGRYLADI